MRGEAVVVYFKGRSGIYSPRCVIS